MLINGPLETDVSVLPPDLLVEGRVPVAVLQRGRAAADIRIVPVVVVREGRCLRWVDPCDRANAPNRSEVEETSVRTIECFAI